MEFQKLPSGAYPRTPHRSLHLRCSFRKSVSIYPRSAPEDGPINGGGGGGGGGLKATVYGILLYKHTNKIPGELLRKNMISSHVKRSPLLWLHNKSRLSQQKAIK